MKKISALFFSFLLPWGVVAQPETEEKPDDRMTYFQCDFSEGWDTGFSMYDLDGQTYHFTMTQEGFRQGEPFATLREKRVAKENYYVASASKYKYAKDEVHRPSDDWLVTPEIWIRGPHAVLSWRGRSFCSQRKNTSGYKVLVSAKGNRPEDFLDAPVLAVESESADEWVNHEVSLDQYAGKRVYIAFVNDNLDKEILGWDDVRVTGEKGRCELVVKTGSHVFGQEAVTVDCALTAYSDEPVTEVTAHYSWQGKTYTKQLSGLSLKKHETVQFSFEEQMPVACGDTVRYEVWAEIDGVQQDRKSCQTVSFLFAPQRRTVVEEGTGMWCGFCPCGIVAMDILEKKYPEEFIGIAIHYDDPMEVKDYRIGMDFPSFPSARFNRKVLSDTPMILVEKDGKQQYTTLEGGFETDFLKVQGEQALADVSLCAEPDGRQLRLQATTRFAVDRKQEDYRLAFVVVEDSVTEYGCFQENYFSGEKVEMGGYEQLPKKILSPVFRHVARGIYEEYRGIPGSVPATVKAGVPYTFDYTLTLPESVNRPEQVKIVAMLLDGKTGEVVNAATAAACATGVPMLEQQSVVSCRRVGDELWVDCAPSASAPLVVQVYTVDGRMVGSREVPGDGSRCTVSIPLRGFRGQGVVALTQAGCIRAVKVML